MKEESDSDSLLLFEDSARCPMVFYIKCSDGSELKRLHSAIEENGGKVSDKLTSRCIYLVDGNHRKGVRTFQKQYCLQYIWDCIHEQKHLDLEAYAINPKPVHVRPTVLTIQEGSTVNSEPSATAVDTEISDGSNDKCESDVLQEESTEKVNEDGDSGESTDEAISTCSSQSDSIDLNKVKIYKGVKHIPYTYKEDEQILRYIRKHKGYKYVKGRAFWLEMEKSGDIPGRSWQSLKERFRKKIYPNLEKFDLSEEERSHFLPKPGDSKNKALKAKYTDDDDIDIIKYIHDNNSFKLVKGVSLYKQMAEELNHPWQSLKERFLKHILPNIEKYQLSESYLSRFERLKSSNRNSAEKKLANSNNPSSSSEQSNKKKSNKKDHEAPNTSRTPQKNRCVGLSVLIKKLPSSIFLQNGELSINLKKIE